MYFFVALNFGGSTDPVDMERPIYIYIYVYTYRNYNYNYIILY